MEFDAGQDGGEDAGPEVDAGTLTVSPTALGYGVEGVAYEVGFEVDGGTPPYVFSGGATLPLGMALSDAGTFSGTPPTVGGFTLQAQVRDSSEPPLSFGLELPWAVHPKLRVAGPGALATAANNAAYNEAISATGGIAPYQFRIVEGTLPGSIQLELDGGVNGVPGGAANVDFTVEVSDSAMPPQVAQRALNFLSANGPLVLKIMTREFPDARVGWPYAYRLQARGGTPAEWSLTAGGALPLGITLNQATGEVSGTPTIPGAATFNIKVVDSLLGSDGPNQFVINVLP
ncbi:MAG: Ig domain-containing protein [Myxococcota bacterium]|nr:Ig domain-containing protein [Myxococcota bacterium]